MLKATIKCALMRRWFCTLYADRAMSRAQCMPVGEGSGRVGPSGQWGGLGFAFPDDCSERGPAGRVRAEGAPSAERSRPRTEPPPSPPPTPVSAEGSPAPPCPLLPLQRGRTGRSKAAE